MVVPAGVMKECADMSFHCAKGEIVKACKFVMITASSVVRDMHSVFDITTIPLHSASARQVQAAVDIAHNVVEIEQLTLEQLTTAKKGLDLLDIRAHDEAVSKRFWILLERCMDLDQLKEYAPWVMFDPKRQAAYLNRIKTLAPDFQTFATVFEEVATLPKEFVSWAMQTMCTYFPPLSVLQYFLNRTRDDPGDILDVFCAFRTGVYYHPLEMMEAVTVLKRKLSQFTKATSYVRLLEIIQDGLTDYMPIPRNKIVYGSCLDFSNATRLSCLLNLEKHPPTFVCKASEWLKVYGNLQEGSLDLEIKLDPEYTDEILLRVAVILGDLALSTTECFRKVLVESRFLPVRTSEFPMNLNRDQEAALTSALKKNPRYIRIDAFQSGLPKFC